MSSSKTYRVGILGIRGRLGSLCAQQALEDSNIELMGGTSREADPENGIFSDALELAKKCDVLIDVSHHSLIADHAKACKETRCAWVIGLTGYTPEELKIVENTSEIIPVLKAANFSPGLAVLCNLATLAGSELEGFDIHIEETHHRNKKDAPSGTALAIADAVKTSKKHDITFSSIRGGGVVGEHSLRFLGDREEICISHRAFDRGLFASGALMAAQWIVGQKKTSGLWSMKDVVASKRKND